MLRNKPPVLTRQLDRCEVCGNKVQKGDLVRTQVEFLDKKGENYALYSSYDGTYWVCDATDAGSVSAGNRCDESRYSVGDDNTLTFVNGVQTWEGNGTLRQATEPGNLDDNIYVVSAQAGPWERSTTPDMTVVIGECDSDGNNKNPISTWNINTTTRVYATIPYTSVTNNVNGVYVYFEITSDGKWWIDEMQLEVNTTDNKPEVFRRTSGAVNVLRSDAASITTRKVCPDCFEHVLKKSEQRGRQDTPPVDEPIDNVVQEF